jgi:ADP-heptose:LPS heptosyltransferase
LIFRKNIFSKPVPSIRNGFSFFQPCRVKILVIRFSSIGDIVLTSPVLRCLHQQVGAEVHFLTKPAFAGLVAHNPHVHRVHTLDQPDWLARLRHERFDQVIDLHHNLRSLRIKWALGRPARSFDKLNVEKWLLVRTGRNFLPNRHIVHRYLDAVQHLGVTYDGAGLDFYVPDEARTRAAFFLKEKTQIDEDQRFVAIVLGAAHATKQLLPEKITTICTQLDSPVILLGGPADVALAQQVTSALDPVTRLRVTDASGQLSLHESADLLGRAVCVVTPDTGLMHIAAALRRPIVSVWGSTVPEFGMYPFYPDGLVPSTMIQVAGLSCRPCSKIGFATCPRGHFRCMREVDVAAVVRAVG